MELLYTLVNSTLDLVYYSAMFMVMISVLVAVHEYGHFLAARLLGVRVLQFSIGFGPALFSRYDSQGTQYRLSLLPLGGYVMMQTGAESDAGRYPGYSYGDASLLARLTICFAGPLANFVLAAVLLLGLLAIGTPGIKPQIGAVQPDSPAALAGLQRGDVLTEVGGQSTPTLQELRLAFLAQANEPSVEIRVERPESGTQTTVRLDLPDFDYEQKSDNFLAALGTVPAFLDTPMIGRVQADSAAAKAGFAVGDRVLAAAGEPVFSWQHWVELVRAHPGVPLEVLVRRNDSQMSLTLVPEAAMQEDGSAVGKAGVGLGLPPELRIVYRVPFWLAPLIATERVYELTELTVTALWQLLTGQLGLENLSGPVGIAQISGQAAQVGLSTFLMVMVLLSISLGVINLAPIPVLDGGRALMHLLEGAFRRPLPSYLEAGLNMFGLMLIVSLMVFTIFQDISRL